MPAWEPSTHKPALPGSARICTGGVGWWVRTMSAAGAANLLCLLTMRLYFAAVCSASHFRACLWKCIKYRLVVFVWTKLKFFRRQYCLKHDKRVHINKLQYRFAWFGCILILNSVSTVMFILKHQLYHDYSGTRFNSQAISNSLCVLNVLSLHRGSGIGNFLRSPQNEKRARFARTINGRCFENKRQELRAYLCQRNFVTLAWHDTERHLPL